MCAGNLPSERTLQRAFNDSVPSSETLLAIVRAQTEIAKLGLDLGGVMSFVTERVQQLTHADGAVGELAEGDEMVIARVRASLPRCWVCASSVTVACPVCAWRAARSCDALTRKSTRVSTGRLDGESACAR